MKALTPDERVAVKCALEYMIKETEAAAATWDRVSNPLSAATCREFIPLLQSALAKLA